MSISGSDYQQRDLTIREVGALRPRLRDDLRATYQEFQGRPCYVLEDPLGGKFYRLGIREYQFVRLLDGTAMVSVIVGKMAARDGDEALDEHEALALVRGLADMGLMEVEGGDHAGRLYEGVHLQGEAGRVMGKGQSLFFLKIPLGNPDRLLAKMVKRLGWLAEPMFFALWLMVIAWAAVSLAGQWQRFRFEMGGVFQVGNIAWLWVAWVVLKVIHEFWHGLVCKKFGGAVPEMGVSLLMLVTPLGYVDASASLAFPSKWRRIFVSAAGMYGEVLVAAIALIVWSQLDSGSVTSAVLQQVILISSVTTLLFNANPLMRFDGYYMLADWIEIPNLYGKGQKMVTWFFKRYGLGIKGAKYPLAEQDHAFTIGFYGILAFAWRMLVMLGLFLMAMVLFKGAGVILAIVVGGLMLFTWGRSVAKYFKGSAHAEKTSSLKVGVRVGLMLVVLLGMGFFVQIRPSIKLSGVVEVSGREEIRIDCPGFIENVYVSSGQLVKKGDRLLRLRNLNQSSWLERLKFDRKRSEVRRDLYYQHEELASYQSELGQVEALTTKITEQEGYVESLDIRAESDGRVYGGDLENLQGQYVQQGTLVMTIADEGKKELLLVVPQEGIEFFRDAVGREIVFRVSGRAGRAAAVLQRVSPRATVEIPHFALATVAGGPLVVRNTTEKNGGGPGQGKAVSSQQVMQQYELARAHFVVRAELEGDAGKLLVEGERVRAKVRHAEKRSLIGLFGEKVRRYLQNISGG
ncbi:MAG: efflux RND transporter periplasmic adaptor subunit [Verrucomicrobiales bacterium]|nr:efflux RND transporter periplasmic adaptor subunit [Verrucomicrobiales bacterium]